MQNEISVVTKKATIAKMFKAYDMRGQVPDLTPEVYYLMGQALYEVVLFPEKLSTKINLFCDARYSSPVFYKAFAAGFLSKGGTIVPMGLATTEMMYASCIVFNRPGVTITASHNPKDDNGLKMIKNYPQILGRTEGLQEMMDYVLERIETFQLNVETLPEIAEDSVSKVKVMELLLQKYAEIGNLVNSDLQLGNEGRRLKIVVDTANGMSGFVLPEIAKLYKNVDFIPLYWEIDGTFPNHPADPFNPANLVDLQAKVREEKADFGIGMDGDGDRAVLIDENGDLVNSEFFVAKCATFFVDQARLNPSLGFNPAIVYVTSYSRALPDSVLAMNGIAIPSKQGHAFVKKEMKEYNAIYGGEASGHHYFGQFGYMDSGLLVIGLVINMLVEEGVKSSELCKFYEDKYFVSGEQNFEMPETANFNVIKAILKQHFEGGIVNELDGLSMFWTDWKFTVRFSQTSTKPTLRVNVETRGQDKVYLKLEEILKVLEIK